eukprot:GHVT01034288.1.p3 GENE.GHVT01034288.1~~GHVT01034288.1.p3  ORF type:complete len:131 (-),score=20.22 GHVT01034288.1:986-1378(-)
MTKSFIAISIIIGTMAVIAPIAVFLQRRVSKSSRKTKKSRVTHDSEASPTTPVSTFRSKYRPSTASPPAAKSSRGNVEETTEPVAQEQTLQTSAQAPSSAQDSQGSTLASAADLQSSGLQESSVSEAPVN